MTDTQLYLIAVLCAFCAGICFASAWQAWRAARAMRRPFSPLEHYNRRMRWFRSRQPSRPGYIRPSLHAYVSGNQGTEQTRQQTAISTASNHREAIREAFTVGHEALADRLKTQSPTPSTSGTAWRRGAPTMAAKRVVLRPVEGPWRSNVSPHTDTDAA